MVRCEVAAAPSPAVRSVGGNVTVGCNLSLLLLCGTDFVMIRFSRNLPGETYRDTVASKVSCGIWGWPGSFRAQGAEVVVSVGSSWPRLN